MNVEKKEIRVSKSWQLLIAAAFTTLCSISAWAESAGQWQSGEQIYVQVCSHCHETLVAPKILGRNMKQDYVAFVVQHGLRAMPAFRPTDFNDRDMAKLTSFVQSALPFNREGVHP
jgi:4-cresol dehydrogenase (hydroxylating) cytochrome subunit